MEKAVYLDMIKRMVQLRGLTLKSERFYLKASEMFLDWCFDRGIEPQEVSYERAQEFVLHLRNDRGYAPKTVNSYISVVRFLFTYIFHRPIDKYYLPSMRVDRKDRQVLSPEEVERYISELSNLKHKAMVALLYGCGLRSSEVAALRYKDISRSGMKLFVESSKNRSSRYVPLPEFVLSILTEYWFTNGKPRDWLFPGAKLGAHISRSTLGSIVSEHSKKFGWTDREVTTHTFRHCLGTHMYEAGCDLFYIQKVLGHRAISSTLVYISAKPDARNPFEPLRGKSFV